jgi:tRNA ligase
MVSSKHSLQSEHAAWGEKWLRKIVEGKGRKLEELAAVLWEKRWTAVAEVSRHVFQHSYVNSKLSVCRP